MLTSLNDLAVLEQLSIGVILADRNYNLVFVNQFMRLKMAEPTARFDAKTISEFYPKEKNFLERKIRTVFILNSPAYSGWQQKAYVFKMDTPHPVTGKCSEMLQDLEFLPVLNSEGETELCAVIIRDATADAFYTRKLQEDTKQKVEASAANIKNERDDLKRLFAIEQQKAILQFSAGFSHEINNPLGYTLSNVNVLQGYVDSTYKLIKQINSIQPHLLHKIDSYYEELPELFTDINEGLLRIKKTVSDLEKSAVINSQFKEIIALGSLLDEILIVLKANYPHLVFCKVDDNAPEVYANKDDMLQVLYQLLDNAFYATRQSNQPYLRISFSQDNRHTIHIIDNGSGIDSTDLPKIYDPFFTTKPIGEGKGLGLTIAKNILLQYGFELKVVSILGKGTKVSIII